MFYAVGLNWKACVIHLNKTDEYQLKLNLLWRLLNSLKQKFPPVFMNEINFKWFVN